MKTTGVVLALMVSFLLPAESRGADPVKLKYVKTVYTDSAAGNLRFPEGVGCRNDSVVIADSGNKRILRYSYRDGIIKADGQFPVSKMYPVMVQMNSSGEMYVLDSRQRQIALLSSSGAPKGILEPTGVPGQKNMVPKSIKIDPEDRLYILDIFSERVLVLDQGGKFLRAVALPEEYGFFSDIAVDRQGNIFLLDSVEAALYKAGKEEEKFTSLTGGLKEFMNFPTSLSVDNRGTIFLVDQYGSGLATLAPDGSFLGRKMGMGWNDGLLHYPSQICINDDGGVFIADRNNNRVQQFSIAQ